MTPNTRRAIRTVIHATGALAMLGFLWWIVPRLQGGQLTILCMGLLAILFVREVFHGAENVAARVKFSANKDGISGEVDPGVLDLRGAELDQ